jgi:hypothetical protein
MKTYVRLLAFLLAMYHCMAGDLPATLDFQLSVAPLEWHLAPGDKAAPLLILWKVKNNSEHRIIVPNAKPTLLRLIDAKGKNVAGGESGDVHTQIIDYRSITPGWSTYISAGDISLYSKNNELFIGGATSSGGWLELGPLIPGKYKLQCEFSADLVSSPTAVDHFQQSELWLGVYSSDWIDIVVK